MSYIGFIENIGAISGLLSAKSTKLDKSTKEKPETFPSMKLNNKKIIYLFLQ